MRESLFTVHTAVSRLNRYLPSPLREGLRACGTVGLVKWLDRVSQPDETTVRAREVERASARVRLLMQFESLGENCELGFVQQAFGANPLGLFRWSGISLPDLVAALDSDLDGIGEPEHTSIYWDETFGEYYFRDLRYGMYTHTRMFRRDYSLEAVQGLLRVRTRRLREKLVEDLQEGEKIFVFQSRPYPDPAEMQGLHKAISRFSPSAELLFVMPAADGKDVGTVRRVAPGLMLGFLDRSGFDEFNEPHWRISYQVWLCVLAAAARRCGRRVSRSATAATSALDLPRSV